MSGHACYTTLQNRGLIHIEGPDRHDFLQKLITNDIQALPPGKVLYACLLTPQGKFLHDFFISEGSDFILLECEGGERAQDLYNRLNQYRLRADVKISLEPRIPVYAVLQGIGQGAGYADPRHADLGWRGFEKPQDLPMQDFAAWDRLRISLCVPDGSRDLVVGSSALDEGRLDQFHAVSYDKGCYLGQELTARMHYRGLGKKHLTRVRADSGSLPPFGAEIRDSAGNLLGEMRSSCGEIGLALLKDDTAQTMSGDSYFLIQK